MLTSPQQFQPTTTGRRLIRDACRHGCLHWGFERFSQVPVTCVASTDTLDGRSFRRSLLRRGLRGRQCRPGAFRLHPTFCRNHDFLATRQVLYGQRKLALMNFARGSLGGDRAAETTRSWPKVIQSVRSLDHFPIVLNHHDRVTQITQFQ